MKSLLSALALVLATGVAHADELRVLTHSSFDLPKPLLAEFERQAGVKLVVVKAGDAGEMLNKLILTRAHPIADVVFGIDNSLIAKALDAGVLDAYTPKAGARPSRVGLPGGVSSVDYGYVTLNYDKAWFAKNHLPLPASLDDLTRPAYRNLLVVENPATSSPGLAFLLSTVSALGEDKAFAFWARLRANGVKVSKGWDEAYYTDFSRNGGSRPIVLSYATSPAAEVFYSKVKLTESPTANLPLAGAVYRQVEGVALVKGGGERVAAGKFIDFMRSEAVQKALQTTMWMYPAVDGTPIDPAFRFGVAPSAHQTPDEATIHRKAAAWIARWTQVVLR
jgi:thiamine transport system substrate-binding protein